MRKRWGLCITIFDTVLLISHTSNNVLYKWALNGLSQNFVVIWTFGTLLISVATEKKFYFFRR